MDTLQLDAIKTMMYKKFGMEGAYIEAYKLDFICLSFDPHVLWCDTRTKLLEMIQPFPLEDNTYTRKKQRHALRTLILRQREGRPLEFWENLKLILEEDFGIPLGVPQWDPIMDTISISLRGKIYDGSLTLFLERVASLQDVPATPDEKAYALAESLQYELTNSCYKDHHIFLLKEDVLRKKDIDRTQVRNFTPFEETGFRFPNHYCAKGSLNTSDLDMLLLLTGCNKWEEDPHQKDLKNRDVYKRSLSPGDIVRVGQEYYLRIDSGWENITKRLPIKL